MNPEEVAKALEIEVNELDSMDGPGPETDPELAPEPEPEPDPPADPDPESDSAPEDPPVEEPPAEPEPPPPPPPAPEPPEDLVAILRNQIETLSQKVMELQAGRPASPAQPASPAPAPAQPPPAAPEEDYDYLNGLDMDDVTTDPTLFNKVLRLVEDRIRGSVAKEAAESALLSIPDVVQYQIKQQAALNDLVKEFYNENNDLTGVKHTVAAVAQNISTERPDWTVKQVFEESAKRTRELLRLPAPGSPSAPPTEPLRPAFADKQGGRDRSKASESVTDLQRQLDEL